MIKLRNAHLQDMERGKGTYISPNILLFIRVSGGWD
jgi:hypothetical protein